MGLGKSCSQTISLENTAATSLAEEGCPWATKCTYLESLSTTTNIASFLWALSKASMKSLVSYVLTCCGNANGCNSPTGANTWYSFLWQMSQACTNLFTSCLIPSQDTIASNLLNDWNPQVPFHRATMKFLQRIAILFHVFGAPACCWIIIKHLANGIRCVYPYPSTVVV
jgi:hypothetical protein